MPARNEALLQPCKNIIRGCQEGLFQKGISQLHTMEGSHTHANSTKGREKGFAEMFEVKQQKNS